MEESSDGFLDRAPSDEGLYKVLQKHPNWETYAIPLGLEAEQVDYFYRMKQGDNGVLALTHWRDGHCGEDHPATWRFLLKVIGDSIGSVPAGDLERKVFNNCKWTRPDTVPPGDCHCFTGMKPSPPASDGMAKFNECISTLKEFYLEDSVIQDNLLEMNPQLKYLPLSYVKAKKETDVKEKERPRDLGPVEYNDIISSLAGGPKQVLLQGDPGSGKSTTLCKICHDFAKSSLPPEIKVVIRVVLGDLEEGSKPELEDLMQTCITEDYRNLIEEITSFAHKHSGEGILFLFDGFDELARDLQEKSLITDILNHKAYPRSSYIITSRSSVTAQLPSQAVQQMDHVKMQGFAKDKMNQFIQQWFQTRPDTGEKVIKIISANSQLCDMCRNPLTALIACAIASEDQMLPDRMTILLKSFLPILANSYLKKKGQEPSIVHWEDLEEKCSSFKALADLALHGFLKGQYVFTDLDSSLPHRPSKLIHMGLFRVTSQKKGEAIVKSYQFFHLIVQEFLSSYALSLKSTEYQTAFWGEHLVKGPIIKTGDQRKDRNLSLYADQRFETIFHFYAGLTSLRDGSIQQLLFNTVDTDKELVLGYHYPVTSEHSPVIYESRNEEVAKQLFSRYSPSLTIRYCKQPQKWMWCLQHVSFSSLTIESLWWGSESPQQLVEQVFDTNKDRMEEVHWTELYVGDVGFPVEMTARCTKLKVLELVKGFGRLAFSSQSFLNVLNKSTSLQTLSLKRVQLSDMDVETVVGDISGVIQQLKNLSDVTLEECSDELARGVVGGVVVSQCIRKFTFGTPFSIREYSEEVLKSLENIKNSKNLREFTLYLEQLPSHYMASIVCGCFQSRTLEKLRILVKEDIADGVDGELMTRLESAIRDNNTLRVLKLNPDRNSIYYYSPPVPASVAEAMLKGAVHNKRLEKMIIRVPDTAELHKLVDEVEEVNKKLRLDVRYRKEPDELENDGEKGVSSVITSQLEEEGENEGTLSSPVTTSPMEEGEKKETQSSSEILSRPEEGEEEVQEKPRSQPTLPLWSTQAQPFLPMPYRHVFHRPGLSPFLALRGVPSPSTPPEKQPSLEDVD